MGVSRKIETATGMGMAVVFVMTVAAAVTWNIQEFILVTFNLEYLQTIMFILVIASLVQFVEMFVRKASPTLYQSLGIFLPLITTNCAVLGVALLTVQTGLNFIATITFAFGSSIGFTLALVLMAGIREQLEMADVPKPFKGTAVAFITAGLLSLAFMGFSGMVK
jgi:electron transport complex protein RnfA